jgi:DNA-binding MurR/RpiR family transcriptional regulator
METDGVHQETSVVDVAGWRTSGVLSLVHGLLPSLPPSQQRIAEATLRDPPGTAASTISELARRCNTSETTVVRFCRALGFDGYPQFRLAIASAVGEEVASGRPYVSGEILADDPIEDVVSKVGWGEALAVIDTMNQADVAALGRCAEALLAAERIEVYGVGASGIVAQDLHQKLHRLGRRSSAWVDPHASLVGAALLTTGDVAIGFSHSGETPETQRFLSVARDAGATTVAVTNFPNSGISRLADILLCTSVREATHRSGAMASRIAQLALVDVLFVLVARGDSEVGDRLITTYETVRQARTP